MVDVADGVCYSTDLFGTPAVVSQNSTIDLYLCTLIHHVLVCKAAYIRVRALLEGIVYPGWFLIWVQYPFIGGRFALKLLFWC